MELFFSFSLGLIVGISSYALAEKWAFNKKGRRVRPHATYLLVGTISIIILTLAYNVFKKEGIKNVESSSWSVGRDTEEAADGLEKEKSTQIRHKIILPQRNVSNSSRNLAGLDLIPPKSALSESATQKSKHQQKSLKKTQKEIKNIVDPVLIKDIKYRKTQRGAEKVFIYSNRFFEPEIFPLEGERPRVVVDIKNALYIEKGLSRINVNGKIIKRIRSYFYRDSNKLRIVLDLEPSKNYYTDQLFYKKDNIYSLVVKEDDTIAGTGQDSNQ